jgi:hypothetical protein
MNVGQDVTMEAGVGETVKPGQFGMPQVRGILAGIGFHRIVRAGVQGPILLENRGVPATGR